MIQKIHTNKSLHSHRVVFHDYLLVDLSHVCILRIHHGAPKFYSQTNSNQYVLKGRVQNKPLHKQFVRWDGMIVLIGSLALPN